jgi:hypothetical protein
MTEPLGLMGALLAVQGELPKLTKDAEGQIGTRKYRYLTLDKLHEEVLPVLNKNGLVWLTLPGYDDNGDPHLAYEIRHVPSDEKIGGKMRLLLANRDPQGQGSGLTYARRYSLLAVIGAVGDEDDDGAQATQRSPEATQSPSTPSGDRVRAQPTQSTEKVATAKQRGLINGRAGSKGMTAIDLAAVVLNATGSEPKDFEAESAATEWLLRAMDRLPARCVDAILAGIEAHEHE